MRTQRAPETCDRCGSSRMVRILWDYSDLPGEEAEAVADGRALLGLNYRHFERPEASLIVGAVEVKESRLPPWACLDCAPRWFELHGLARAELEAETGFVTAVDARDFATARAFLDAQERLQEEHAADFERLLKELLSGEPISEGCDADDPIGTHRGPETCPRCGSTRIVRILWCFWPFLSQETEAVAEGRALLGPGHHYFKHPESSLIFGSTQVKASRLPGWACLACAPAWTDLHDLAKAELESQTAKEAALCSQDFERAAALQDVQHRLEQAHAADIERLLKELIADEEMGDGAHAEPRSPADL